MDVRRVDWSLFRSFLAVVDSGSVLGAAKRLGSHQPTVSRHIAELEAQLGVSLFDRNGRGAIPTAAGRAIVGGARLMAEGLEAVETSVMGVRSPEGGVVHLACSEVIATFILPRYISRLVSLHPEIQIDLVVSNLISNLGRREADIAIRMVRPTESTLTARKLGDLALGLFASSGYLARRGEPATLDQLKDHALVGLDADDSLIRGFHAAGIALDREHFSVRTDNQVAYIRLVQSGVGIGVMPVVVGRDLLKLCPVLATMPTATLPVWLVVHREISDSPVIRTVFDFLAAELKSALIDGALTPQDGETAQRQTGTGEFYSTQRQDTGSSPPLGAA
jgi:DNA-binding transcriptional LysR family regulator